MATNLCAECGSRLLRPDYKTHMQQVHGVSVMDDSDEEHTEIAQTQEQGQAPAGAGAEAAPRPQRPRRRGRNNNGGGGGDGVASPTANGSHAVGYGSALEGTEMEPRARGDGGGSRRRGSSRFADGKNEGEFACTECDRTFASAQGLQRHTQAKHPDCAGAIQAAATAAAAAPALYPVRRGGRPRYSTAAEGGGGGSGNGDEAVAENGDTAAAPRISQRQRPWKPRVTAATATAPQLNAADAVETAAVASAAADAALGGAPAEFRPDRLVTLLRCKLCEQGFKSKNRASDHVREAHPERVAPKQSEAEEEVGNTAAAGDGPRSLLATVEDLLEMVQVPARRPPRSGARRGRQHRGTADPSTTIGEGQGIDGDDTAAPRRNSGVRRGGRPPKRAVAEAAATAGGGKPAPAVEAARAADELAALGIVSSS